MPVPDEVGFDQASVVTLGAIALSDGKHTLVLVHPTETQTRDVVTALAEADEIIGHDLKSAFHAFALAGADADTLATRPVFDTMVAAYLLAPGGRDFAFSDLVREYLGASLPDDADALGNVGAVLPLAAHLKTKLAETGMAKLAEGVTILLDIDRLMHIQEAVLIGEAA